MVIIAQTSRKLKNPVARIEAENVFNKKTILTEDTIMGLPSIFNLSIDFATI